jgi:dUTP pyrophosphatase
MSMKHPLGPHNRVRITNIDNNKDVQPNSIDLKIDKVFMPQQSVFILSEERREHRGAKELSTRVFNNEPDWWCLQPGFYEIVFQNEIRLPKGEAGFVIPRSSLVRNGIYLATGLYDSGYEGMMVSGLHVTVGPFYVKKGTRLAQFLLFEAETLRKYDGAYGNRKQHDNEKYQIRKAEGWVDARTTRPKKQPEDKKQNVEIDDEDDFVEKEDSSNELDKIKNMFEEDK